MTAWTITTAVTFSDMDGGGTDYAAGDTLTINSGGTVTADLSIGGAGSGAITVNAGGVLIINPGISLLWANAAGLTINEGGICNSLGTTGSHVSLTFGGQTNAANKIAPTNGGKFFACYTDITNAYAILPAYNGIVDLSDCTISTTQYPFLINYGANIKLMNCTIAADTATRYVFLSSYSFSVCAINCAFTSTTDNYLAYSTYMMEWELYGCTYAGGGGAALPIAADDFPLTTQDINIRIYEASVMTVAANLAGVSVSPKHPSQDSMGFLYDTTNYMKMPAFLSVPDVTGATGATSFFGLQKSAYWPSGLAVGSRTWKYWSASGQAETGDNQKITATASKVGYLTDSDTDWIGAAMTATVTANITHFQGAGGLWGTNSYENIWLNIRRVTAYPSTATLYDFLMYANKSFVIPTGGLVVYLYDFDGILLDTLYTSIAPLSLTGGVFTSLSTLAGSREFTTPATPGKYMMVVEIYDPARPDDYLWCREWIEVIAVPKDNFRLDGETW